MEYDSTKSKYQLLYWVPVWASYGGLLWGIKKTEIYKIRCILHARCRSGVRHASPEGVLSRDLPRWHRLSVRPSHHREQPLHTHRRELSLILHSVSRVTSNLDPTDCFSCWGKKARNYRERVTHSGTNVRGTIMTVKNFDPAADAEKLRSSIDGTGKKIYQNLQTASCLSKHNTRWFSCV